VAAASGTNFTNKILTSVSGGQIWNLTLTIVHYQLPQKGEIKPNFIVELFQKNHNVARDESGGALVATFILQ
jgi:hypothetical protein